MAQLIYSSFPEQSPEQRFVLQKKITTVGTEASHDVIVMSKEPGLLFTLIQQPQHLELVPGRLRVRLNGQAVSWPTPLRSCDRLEWNGGVLAYLSSPIPALEAGSSGAGALRSLQVLQNLASTLQRPGALPLALNQALEALVEMAGAESGYLLSDLGGAGWEMVASRKGGSEETSVGRKELFSNTILQEALRRNEPVHVENIIGHPWADSASVIEARIFSAACFPLRVDERTLGAVFLLTRSAGKTIRKESLPELNLLATQAALLLGLEAELKTARTENARLRGMVNSGDSELVYARESGARSPMQEIERKVEKLAATPLSVLILGETGTGKEVIARELHRRSERSKAPFVAVNCAAIPSTLLESTLFGHEKGAFTGATRAQPGKFAQADGGTLFLDEIGDLPLELQAKLLRVLQEKVVEPLGATRPMPVNVRILAATHQDLEAAARSGRFRQDLYFRLNGATVKLPPLRERKGDIPALAKFFLGRVGRTLALSDASVVELERHVWPGNIRELEQVLTRAAFMCESQELGPGDLELGSGAFVSSPQAESFTIGNLQDAQLAFTRDYVEKALALHHGSRGAAAATLGISERTLYRILATDELGRS